MKIQTLELLNCIVFWITAWDNKIKSKRNQTWRLAIYLLLFLLIVYYSLYTILYMLHNLILLIEIQKYNPVHEVFFSGEVNYNSKVW